jgi:hypothetical protein
MEKRIASDYGSFDEEHPLKTKPGKMSLPGYYST